MNRYRSYGQQDDQPQVAGDRELLGVDEYNTPENIQPGNVQKAVNIDFSSRDGATRGGFVCYPEVGSVPFGLAASWTTRTTPLDKQWVTVAASPSRVVALQSDGSGSNDVMTSTNGVNWTVGSTDVQVTFKGLAYGNGLFVAVGDSTTGFSLITSSGDTFVTSGGDTLIADPGFRVATSVDGITWTQRMAPARYAWSSVAYGNGLFVAVANGNGGTTQVMTSSDGITWTLQTTPSTQSNHNWISVTYGNSGFVAVASGGTGTLNRAMYSTDGVTWLAGVTPADPAGLVSVTYGNGLYVAVATTSASGNLGAVTSTNGATWTARNTTYDDWTSVVFANATFTAVGNSGTASRSVMISTDGTTWTTRAASSGNAWSAVTYGLNQFIAVSTNGTNNQVMTANPTRTIWATGLYSNPDEPAEIWMMLVSSESVGFYANGRSSRSISLAGYNVTEQSTIVQADNQVYLFRGEGYTPLYWNGDWNGAFAPVPDTTLPSSFNSIPSSNEAVYYQNRLWVVNGKDSIAASDVLSFTDYDPLANELSVNTGNSDYVVAMFPFGQNSLIVFKNKSVLLLQNVEGSLSDVTTTEITRQVGLVGINAVCSIGPDLAYVSNRNINLLTLTSTNNSLQHKTLPLSSKIRKIMGRVNWQYSQKISLGYWNNKLYVALPVDGSTVCNAVAVYNFITENWYGEWTFDASIAMNIQSFQVVDYLGLQRLHAITDDGRIFVTDEGYYDISGNTVAEISTELVTRAYETQMMNHFQRRMFIDVATNRPSFSCTTYTEGANEDSSILTNQTYNRSQSWLFNDSTYDLTNANDDYNRAYRKDYATGPDSVQSGTGFEPEMLQEQRLPLISRRQGRLSWIKIANAQGFLTLRTIGYETRPGQRSNLTQV